MTDHYEFKVKFTGNQLTWEEIKAEVCPEPLTYQEAYEVAAKLAQASTAEEVRYNVVGSLQGHYISSNMLPLTITKNGQTVDCYGEWEEDSNAICVFDDEFLDGTWCEGAESWEEAVDVLTKHAIAHKAVLVELQAC